MTSKTRRLVKIVILVGIVYTSAYGFLFSLRFALGTEFPVVIVKGTSMIPTYYDGDLLILKGAADKNTIELGDVIVFHSPYDWDTLIVHRVVEKKLSNNQLIFYAHGDNNPPNAREYVREEFIVGVVIGNIPYAGGAVTAIQSPYGLGILYSLMICVIIIDVLYGKE